MKYEQHITIKSNQDALLAASNVRYWPKADTSTSKNQQLASVRYRPEAATWDFLANPHKSLKMATNEPISGVCQTLCPDKKANAGSAED